MQAYAIKFGSRYIKEAPCTVTPEGEGGLMFAKYFPSRQMAYNYKLQYMYCKDCRPVKLHDYTIVKVNIEEVEG